MMNSKLLIADDAGFIREILTRICDSAGFQVIGEAADGEEVIRLAQILKPGIILMDLVMPKKNGIEATREIIASGLITKIIACSTLGDEEVINQALEAGCIDYIQKPFNRSKVVEVLNRHCREAKGEEYV